MIKAIIFDCFGVLTTDMWKEFRGLLPQELQQQAHDINHAYDAGFISEKEFIEQIRELTGRDAGEVERLKASETHKNMQLLSYIETLKPRYKIGMLSNIASNWVTEEFLTLDEQKLFDAMIFSYQIQLTKPDPRAFNAACKQLEVIPDQVVLVDDISDYCESARSIGMQAVVYQNFAQMKQELEIILSDS